MLNFLGLCQNLSVLAQTSWDSEFLFKDERTGALANLDALTFTGWVIVQDAKREIRCTRSGLYNHLLAITLPKLPEGRWDYEVFASIETGAKCRMIYGSVTAVGGLDSDEGELYDTRTLELRLPGDAQQRIQAEWKATSAAIMAANEARAVLAAVQKVEVKLDGIDDAVQAVNDARDDAISARDEAQDIVDNAPREYIPTISDDGYWVINGDKTTKRAVAQDGKDGEDGIDGVDGKDGINGADGTTIVRHIISDIGQLPASGDTCNGGHVYYLTKLVNSARAASGWIRNDSHFEADTEIAIGGVSIKAPSYDCLNVEFANAINESGCGVHAEWQEGSYIHLTADAEGAYGNDITLAWVNNPTSCALSGDTLTGGADAEYKHELYAWCINAQGAGAWELVISDGLANAGSGGGDSYWGAMVEEATAHRPGTVKLGSDELPQGKTLPVRKDRAGRMCVDDLSTPEVAEATAQEPGTVRLGSDEAPSGETAPVKKDAQGRMVVETALTLGSATYDRNGTVKRGSQYSLKCNIPYLLSITTDEHARMMQNLLPGGALKHMQQAGWSATGTLGVNWSALGDTSYGLGLHTSPSFRQSEANGLELNHATRSRVGGVTLAESFEDAESAHVLDAGRLKALLDLLYYNKTQVNTKLESYIKTNTTLFNIRIMTQDEYDALAQIDAHTLYLVY